MFTCWEVLGLLLHREEQRRVWFDQGEQRNKTSTGFESAKGWRGPCVPGGTGSQDKKDSSVLPNFALRGPVPTHHQQTLPHLGGGGRL